MKYSCILICLAIIPTFIYLIGILFFLTDREPNDKCLMTYMFEYPQYVKISQKIDKKYPKYGLYAYGEGRMTNKARNMQFDGIPVIFIPGNAGSHQQVRSLSSVALRIALNSGSPYHFDYFTIDLNSEYSAIYGPLLYQQLEYVGSSIYTVLDLYKSGSNKPKKIILIGHSVGGIVAKKVISTLSMENSNMVSILITLSAPLNRGFLYFDRYSLKFYNTSKIVDQDVTSVNIAGGYSDLLIPTYLTEDDGANSINLVATNVPRCWVESNHVQILWCKQLVLAINRALFDSVDKKTRQISTDKKLVQKVFRHHLIHNSGTTLHFKPSNPNIAKIDYKGEWIESLYKQYSIYHAKGVKQTHWYMAALTLQPSYEWLTVLAVNLEVTDWVFTCSAAFPRGPNKVCVEAEHLTQFSEIMPSTKYKRRLITINMHEIRKNNSEYSHVVFRVLPTSEPVTFHVDIYGSQERRLDVSLPKFSFTKETIVSETPPKAVIYELYLPQLSNLLQVYLLYVEPISCSVKQHHASATLIVPWANENVHSYTTDTENKPLVLRLQSIKPQNAESAKVRLVLEPTCSYKISTRLHIIGVFGQFARYYSPFLLTHMAVMFLLGFQNQIYIMGKIGKVPLFFTALIDGLKNSWVLVGAFLMAKCLSLPFFTTHLPQPDVMYFPNKGDTWIDFIIVPIILHVVSLVMVIILVAFYCVSLFTLESTVHKLTLKLLARTLTFTMRFSDYLVAFLQKVPFLVAATLITLCFTTCGGLALCVGAVFYFLKLTQMSQEYVEQVAWLTLKTIAKQCKDLIRSRMVVNNTSNGEQQETEKDSEPERNIPEVYGEEDMILNKEVNTIDEGSNEAQKHEIKDDETPESVKSSVSSENEVTEQLDSEDNENETIEEQNVSKLSSKHNALFFQSSMFFLWVIITILNIPAVLVWAHNFKFSKSLYPDESFLPGLILSVNALPLWQLDFPRVDRKFTYEIHLITLYFIIVCLVYATITVYLLNYILTLLFAVVVLQQCYAPKDDTQRKESEDSDAKDPLDSYEAVKKKID